MFVPVLMELNMSKIMELTLTLVLLALTSFSIDNVCDIDPLIAVVDASFDPFLLVLYYYHEL